MLLIEARPFPAHDFGAFFLSHKPIVFLHRLANHGAHVIVSWSDRRAVLFPIGENPTARDFDIGDTD
jgi:hypothetical protein